MARTNRPIYVCMTFLPHHPFRPAPFARCSRSPCRTAGRHAGQLHPSVCLSVCRHALTALLGSAFTEMLGALGQGVSQSACGEGGQEPPRAGQGAAEWGRDPLPRRGAAVGERGRAGCEQEPTGPGAASGWPRLAVSRSRAGGPGPGGAPAERVPVFLCRESGPQLPGAAVDTQRRGPVLPVLPVRPLLLARGFPPKQAAVRRWSYLFLKAKMMQPSPLWEGWGVGMGCLAPLNQQPWKITAGRLGGLSQRWKKSVPMDASC